ncbi:MAG: hypothetical protein OHK0039_16890 [Bacteroidia bacterium]
MFLPATLAQAQRGKGLQFDDQAYATDLTLPTYGSGSKFGELPLRKNLEAYAPYPGDQGYNGSCVGWAVGYAAYSIERAVRENNTDRAKITEKAYSAMYIYNNIRVGDCPDGAVISDAFEFLAANGDCFYTQFNPEDCTQDPDNYLRTLAEDHRIETYMTIFEFDAEPEMKVFRTKQMIAQDKPVAIGMMLRANFDALDADDEYWDPYAGDTRYTGGHAMCVVGYDEARKAFRIMNSWGRAWGQDGFIWVKYDAYGEFCKYGYAMHLGDAPSPEPDQPQDEQPEVSLSGRFAFRYPIPGNSDQIMFENAVPRWIGDHYELERTDWHVGDLFQLVAMNTKANEYIYVFSLDPTNKPNIHWPRQASLGFSNFFGMNEVPLNPIPNSEIVIPGEETALQLAHPGSDYLCVLFSSKRIDDFEDIVRTVQNRQGGFMERLASALGTRMIPQSDIRFDNSSMQFSARSTRGHIVPLVLKVIAN